MIRPISIRKPNEDEDAYIVSFGGVPQLQIPGVVFSMSMSEMLDFSNAAQQTFAREMMKIR